MTQVIFEIGKDTPEGIRPLHSAIVATPTAKRWEGDVLVLRTREVRFAIPDGASTVTVDLDATEPWWAWEIRYPGEASGFYFVPESPGPVHFKHLPQVDPETLDPIAEPEAAWWAEIDRQIQSGEVVGDDLILTHRDGSTTNAGEVVGAPGEAGADGPPNTLDIDFTALSPGSSPTASISGTAPSQTLHLGVASGVQGPQGLPGDPTAYELRGEGFPGTGTNAASTNAAAPGTYYTDTAGTNGAWRWLKTAAGTGSARWTVVYGDTGWRKIVGWANGGEVEYGEVPDGATPTSYAGGLFLRREAGTCYYLMRGVARSDSGSSIGISAPLGWRRPGAHNISTPLVYGGAVTQNAATLNITSSQIRVFAPRGASLTSGAGDSLLGSWITSDAWPTTLPGTAE